MAGDFNAKAPKWGGTQTDPREEIMCELAAELDHYICNVGEKATFRRGASKSIIDITLATNDLMGEVID